MCAAGKHGEKIIIYLKAFSTLYSQSYPHEMYSDNTRLQGYCFFSSMCVPQYRVSLIPSYHAESVLGQFWAWLKLSKASEAGVQEAPGVLMDLAAVPEQL